MKASCWHLIRKEKLILAVLLLTGLFIHSGCGQDDPVSDLYAQAEAFILSQQSSDGRWRSQSHAVLRSGQALTPYITMVLLEGKGFRDESKRRAAYKALHAMSEADQQPGFEDSLLVEYPTYSVSLLIRALTLMGDSVPRDRIDALGKMLLTGQYDGERGIAEHAPFFGGWGFGEANIPHGSSGMIDLSHTRRALEALSLLEGVPNEVFENARIFLRNMQVSERPPVDSLENWYNANKGGFYFSPVSPATNKGGGISRLGLYNAYATTTCDGILASLAAGFDESDAIVRDALDWLVRNPALDQPAGIHRTSAWYGALFYYHLAVRAEVYHRFDMPGNWRNEIFNLLAERVQEDGSFFNPYGAANKEDDPLVATTMALRALHFIMQE